MTWEIFSGTPAEWDAHLEQLPDFSYLQSHGWGEHKALSGWQPLRLLNLDEQRVTAMAQVLLRLYPLGTGLAWIPGGPTGDAAALGEEFREALLHLATCSRLYCRASLARPYSGMAAVQLREGGWQRATHPLQTGLSMVYDPAPDETARLTAAHGNWRHNLRRSAKHNLRLSRWESPRVDEMLAVYGAMEGHKGLSQQFAADELHSMLRHLGTAVALYRCDDAEGELVALRGCARIGERAWDLFAAATPKARKIYATYATFWHMIEDCHATGVKFFDFGGIDPVNNRGVYDFKKGSGAAHLEYLGEWDWATSEPLRLAANWAIARRGRGL